ncbi:MAG TPA: response regulator transcription factor [Polyangiales bacterium]|nr:response regulator transcription factor [Polyangiales bacterium]
MSRIRILIADDHAVVREGLVRVLSDQQDMRVVAEASNGDEAIAAARTSDPHLVLLDMRMPGLGGAAAIRKLRECCPRVRVLVLSMYEDPHYRRAALAAGAHGYLGKSSSSDELVRAIRSLNAGQAVSERRASEASPRTAAALSAREQEIVRMIVAGRTSREIAVELGITKSSVDTYRARVSRKLGVDSRAELFERVASLGEPAKEIP